MRQPRPRTTLAAARAASGVVAGSHITWGTP
jgi:hypothetical protein